MREKRLAVLVTEFFCRSLKFCTPQCQCFLPPGPALLARAKQSFKESMSRPFLGISLFLNRQAVSSAWQAASPLHQENTHPSALPLFCLLPGLVSSILLAPWPPTAPCPFPRGSKHPVLTSGVLGYLEDLEISSGNSELCALERITLSFHVSLPSSVNLAELRSAT